MRTVLVCLCAWIAMPACATTYYFVGGLNHLLLDHTTCSAGICADFPPGARVTGSFTTAAPFAPNLLAADRSALVTSFSFFDGVTTYTNGNANARLFWFTLGTDAAGLPTGVHIEIQQWQAVAPHDASNDRYDEVSIFGVAAGAKNRTCTGFGASPNTGAADTCTGGAVATDDTSFALSSLPQQWSVDVPIVVPPNVATTYYVASGPYTLRIPHLTCSAGVCADFPLGGRTAGSFTTAARIPSGLPATEISGLVTAFAFFDGVTSYSSADARSRISSFNIGTDAGGAPVDYFVQLQRWQSAVSPHAVGDRFDSAALVPSVFALTNRACVALGPNDTCQTAASIDDDSAGGVSLLPTRSSIGAPLPLGLDPTTYSVTSAPYTTIDNHTTCVLGTCADFTPTMRITGTFTLADRLPPNFALDDVSGLVSAYSISNGIASFSNVDPQGRSFGFRLATGPNGVPSDAAIGLERWQAGSPPHLAGSRIDLVTIAGAGGITVTNGFCDSDAVRVEPGRTLDVCTDLGEDTNRSRADSVAPVVWSIVGAAVRSANPVPGPAGGVIAFLVAMLAVAGAWVLRRRATRSL